MEWLCNCGRPVTTLELQWEWREASAIGHRHGRFVCYGCQIGCGECVHDIGDKDYQYFEIKLTAGTKRELVGQVLAEVIRKHPRGYIPRTDLQAALRTVRKTA